MLSDFLNNLWPNLPVIAGVLAPFLTASSLSVAGLVPSFGPGRALWIILRSRFRPNTTPLSLRHTELATLGQYLKQKTWGQNYLVVTGEKGVGKSRMISTALNKRASVITVKTLPTDNAHTVLQKSLNALTSLQINLIDPTPNANRVIFFHRIFTCGRTPIVVINTAERRVGEPALSLTGVVRALVDDYGLRVVIDSSPNSVDETLLRTNREIVVDVQPMNKETIWSLPQLQDLFQLTKENDLDEVTWAVLGGNPSKYEQLYKQYQGNIGSKEGKEKGELLGQLLCEVVYAATKIVRESRSTNVMMKKIICLFDSHVGSIPSDLVESEGLIRPSPDKVFREVEKSGKTVLIPASNAINIVLRYNMSEKPTLEELKEAAGVVNDVTLKLPIDMDSDEEEKRENGMSKKKQKQKMLTD